MIVLALAALNLTASIKLTYDLDSDNPVGLSAIVEMTPIHDSKEYEVKLNFCVDKGNKPLAVKSLDLGSTFTLNAVQTAHFTRSEREQLLITLAMGSVRTWIFDFDGRRVSYPYKFDEGKIWAYPSLNSKGMWQMVEYWPTRRFLEVHKKGKHDIQRGRDLIHIVNLPFNHAKQIHH